MKIRISGKQIDKCSNLNVTIMYNSVKSVFSFDLYWNPFEKSMRKIMLPGAYNYCTIVGDTGEIALTGIIIAPSFESDCLPHLVNITGYSLTGVLDDVKYSAIFDSHQNTGLTLLQITKNICSRFALKVVDKTNGLAEKAKIKIQQPNNSGTQANAETQIDTSVADVDMSCTEYINSLCKDLNINLSHDRYGNLVLSIVEDKTPLFDFGQGVPGIKYTLQFNGECMHSTNTAHSQGGNDAGATVTNPYVGANGHFNVIATGQNLPTVVEKNRVLQDILVEGILNEYAVGYRPEVVIQTTSDSKDLMQVAKDALAKELEEGIKIGIVIHDWDVPPDAGTQELRPSSLPMPDNYINLLNPELYLFRKTKLFIQSVTYNSDASHSTATLVCVVPECYNGESPINIFTYEGNNEDFAEHGEHAVITPYDITQINL